MQQCHPKQVLATRHTYFFRRGGDYRERGIDILTLYPAAVDVNTLALKSALD